MNITNSDRIKLILSIYTELYRMPLKTAFKIFLKPVDSVRYWEFLYLIKFLKNNSKTSGLKILDISSPFVLSYVLSRKNNVIKSDINKDESRSIKNDNNLRFQLEDATSLSYGDKSFDLVYSISVIEHIYGKYTEAIKEMIRVTRKGGYIYLSFPVSGKYSEEWIEEDIYSHQYKKEGKTFFQYRFDSEKLSGLLNYFDNVEIISKSIYWEKKNGDYNAVIKKIKYNNKPGLINFIKNSLINLKSGFTLLNNSPAEFNDNKSFGNISILIKKL